MAFDPGELSASQHADLARIEMIDRLDGNAIGGLLLDVLGAEMTTATGVCASCGASRQVAELHVYLRAPAPSSAVLRAAASWSCSSTSAG